MQFAFEGKAPAGRSQETGAFRYLITIAEQKTDTQARAEPSRYR